MRKRVLVVLIAFLLITTAAFADMFTFFENKTEPGVGITKSLTKMFTDWTCQVDFTGTDNVSVTDNITVSLEGNLRGSTYYTLKTYTLTTADHSRKMAIFTVSDNMTLPQLRGRLLTLGGYDNATASMVCVGR